jgi:phospholipid/cholesterol/gamma-HCH transport system substrate-binding protein
MYSGGGKPMLMARHPLRRVLSAVATSIAALGVIVVSGSCAPQNHKQHAEFCAIMPDAVGLYVDNPVTQMGYRIGKVTAVTPSASDVRVGFTVDSPRLLPYDVRAVIRSTSILADRSLELVGNFEGGPQLPVGGCIPLNRSSTPKTLSEAVGAATDFINSINPNGSTNIGDVVRELDQAIHNRGGDINILLTTASSVLDRPDQAIGDVGSIVTNLAQLTSRLSDMRGTLKQVLLDAEQVAPDLATANQGAEKLFEGLLPIIPMVADIERELGGEIQQTLDVIAVAVRKLTPRAPFYASLLNPVPRWINGLANIVNNHQFSVRYRPPLYRIHTPDGVALCNVMNASMPGSCANVNGTPYAVDVALLQYVLTEANR